MWEFDSLQGTQFWLPYATESNYRVKLFLVPTVKVREREDYFDFRKFVVNSKIGSQPVPANILST